MCGIFAYTGYKKNAKNIVLNGLKSLEYRGYDSWGIAVSSNQDQKHFFIKKQVGKIGNATVKNLPGSSLSLGHTRWATHGGVTKKNAHPHSDCHGSIILVHNGIIENFEEIKRELVKKGHKFKSETDTEVASHLVEALRKKYDFPEAVRLAFLSLKGLNAFIVAKKDTSSFVAVRNGSPLVIGFGNQENFIASDAVALLPHTKLVYFLKDHELAVVDKNQVSILNVKTGTRKQFKPQRLTWSLKQAQKGNFKHFMIKEIHEQPAILTRILAKQPDGTNKLAAVIKRSVGTYLVGCGTAAHACLAGSYFFSKIAKLHINWAIGSEFGYQLDFLTKKSLVVALSQSGETMDILESVKKAKNKGATIASLVNVVGSALFRESDYRLLIGAGPEKAVASTKAFTSKLAHLLLIAFALNSKLDQGEKALKLAINSSKKVLDDDSVTRIKALANKIKHKKHIYIIGRGLSYPASLETALKIKEISYIHAEGFAAGELKHGVIALVEKGTPCIAFLPNDETYGANLAGTMEMKARGGHIIGISHKPHGVFDDYLKVQDALEATIIPNTVAGQLLAYYLTTARNLDPDMPRNLAKSVTVK